jgi:Tol biopolymer transport system component
MKATSILLVLFLSSCMAVLGQMKKGAIQKLIDSEEYSKALEALPGSGLELSDSCFYNYATGLCHLQLGVSPALAVDHLKRAAQCYPLASELDKVSADRWFFYGQALHANYQFEEAIEVFNSLKNRLGAKQIIQMGAIDRELEYCSTAIRLAANPVKFTITNLGKAFNTEFEEHSPVVDLSEDQIIFTSNRKVGKNKDGEEELYSSIWREGRWLPARRISGQLAQYGNNASVSISSDGKMLILYSHDGKSGNLYYSINNKGRWNTPVKFPSPINSSHNETHASITPDGQTIFFTSDRPGGFGGKDIYLSRRLPQGDWGPALNLGPVVNTPMDEESPFIMADGKTLYFASEGHENMGGFDVFKTMRDGLDGWKVPQNVGYPINTPGDDLFYCPTADGLRVYYASTREGTTGNADLFLIEFPSDDENRQAVVSGFVYKDGEKPASDATIVVEQASDSDIVGYYKPNKENGKYLLVLNTGINYSITISEPGYEDVTIDYSVPLKGEFAARGLVHYINPVVLKRE